MLYEFKLDHNTAAIKNIWCVKSEGAADHNILYSSIDFANVARTSMIR